jgi:hypothetical protein
MIFIALVIFLGNGIAGVPYRTKQELIASSSTFPPCPAPLEQKW